MFKIEPGVGRAVGNTPWLRCVLDLFSVPLFHGVSPTESDRLSAFDLFLSLSLSIDSGYRLEPF